MDIRSADDAHDVMADTIEAPLEKRPPGCVVPLTPWQRRVWEKAARNGRRETDGVSCCYGVRIAGALDLQTLRKSLDLAVARHDCLRTRILALGTVQQWIDEDRGDCLVIVDLSHLQAEVADDRAARLAQEYAEQRADLSTGPLFQAVLLRLSDREHVLLLIMDHMVADATSCLVLGSEVWTAYCAIWQGRPPALPSTRLQFADYAVWLERTHASWAHKHGPYWRARLSGAPPIRFPVDQALTAAHHPPLAALSGSLDAELTSALRSGAQRAGTMLPLVLLSALVVAVSIWCDQEDLLVAFVTHGRHESRQMQSMLGLLAEYLHLRLQLSSTCRWPELLKQINREFAGALQHRDFHRLPLLLGEAATSQLYFNWLPGAHLPASVLTADCDLQITPFPVQQRPQALAHATPFVALSCSESPAGIQMHLVYSSQIFRAQNVRELLTRVQVTAAAFASNPGGLVKNSP